MIVEKQGNYLFGLKENQRTLHDNVALFIESEINASEIETFSTIEKNRGRIEKRICTKVTNIQWLHEAHQWEGLRTVFAIRRIININEKTTDETSYYITSLHATPKELLRIAREHWKVESMHWMLDVVFSEDECRLLSENGQKTLNSFRKLALLLHKKMLTSLPKQTSVKASLRKALMFGVYLWSIVCNL